MKRFLLLLFVLFSLLLASAAVRAEASLSFCVNEICSDNGGNYLIANAAADYVELRNLTDQAISLDGFFISDDQDHLNKFSLNGYELPENGYLILAADKKELPFKLSGSEGEELFISDGENHILQQVHLPPLEKDTTYSLQESGEWHITEPTPMAENAEGTPYVKKVYVASPRFSHEAGFYDAPFDLAIDCYKTYRVYYTTDGAVPDEHATLYTAPIHIEDATSNPNTLSMRTDITIDGATPPVSLVKKATIIRAVAIDQDGNRSNEVTNTYFVGFQNYRDYQDISILSIVTDPGDLFDEDNGIYVVGKMYRDWLNSDQYSSEMRAYDRPRNYGQHGKDWEIPASIQWFDENEKLCLSQNVGLRIHGNQTREYAQKAMNLYARKEYGDSKFNYPLIDGVDSMSKLVVRGQVGRDSLTHSLLRETGLPVSGYTPCLVFINGEFWGFYELREKQEEDYLANLFGINKDDLMIFKNYRLIEGIDEDGKTNMDVYENLASKIISNNPSTVDGYAYACDQIDMDNYITYMAGITFCNSEDIFWNKTLWRTMTTGANQYEDGRWRWIFQDLDWTFNMTDSGQGAMKNLVKDELFMALWKNPVFQKQFLTRIMDYANIELTPEYVKECLSPVLTYYNKYLAINNQRWKGVDSGDPKMGTKRLSSIISFLDSRRSLVIEYIKSFLEIPNETSTLKVIQIQNGPQLTINGHDAHIYGSSWEGVYFTGCEVILETGAIPGYKFSGWYENGTLLTEQASVTVPTDANHTLTPAYDPIPDIAVMDRINYARSNYRNGYVLYKRNQKSNCVIEPDAALDSYADFTSINISSEGKWEKGTGFTVTFPTDELSSCGMILYCTVPEGCPKQWALYYEEDSGAKTKMDVTIEETKDGTCFSFDLPPAYMGLPEVILHLESAEDCPGGTIQITKIRLYGEAAEET